VGCRERHGDPRRDGLDRGLLWFWRVGAGSAGVIQRSVGVDVVAIGDVLRRVVDESEVSTEGVSLFDDEGHRQRRVVLGSRWIEGLVGTSGVVGECKSLGTVVARGVEVRRGTVRVGGMEFPGAGDDLVCVGRQREGGIEEPLVDGGGVGSRRVDEGDRVRALFFVPVEGVARLVIEVARIAGCRRCVRRVPLTNGRGIVQDRVGVGENETHRLFDLRAVRRVVGDIRGEADGREGGQ
jgi:hypothetical protein